MCGIAGIYSGNGLAHDSMRAMLARLSHRGPDDSGIWDDAEAGLTLGHARLSVVDLTPAGQQPMLSGDGQHVLVFNGEIYNHRQIRLRLEAQDQHSWRGTSDTEVLLTALQQWGIREALHQSNGMFAFAWWDRTRRRLTLARDRLGEKPLYFGWTGRRFAFASELKAFACLPEWSPRMETAAITSVLVNGFVQGIQSAVAGIFRLPPGTFIELELSDLEHPRDLAWVSDRLQTYWSLADVATQGLRTPISDQDDALEELDNLLRDAVELRLLADVPVGTFLSGGIDSSLVTAIAQAGSTSPVRTFSIGFESAGFDEAPYARAVARHLGTSHTELYVDASAAAAMVPCITEIYDEPIADFSQIPTLLVSRLARQHVTVAITGDGGDEVFAGYGRYPAILTLWRHLSTIPRGARRAAAFALYAASRVVPNFGPRTDGYDPLAYRVARLSTRICASDLDSLRLAFIGSGADRIIVSEQSTSRSFTPSPVGINEPLRRLLYGDQSDYLPDDILVKVDRASMAFGLETRIPLLDHRVVELAWRLPTNLLINGTKGKVALRKLLARYVPTSLTERPKRGFTPPLNQWLRGPLREWAESRLTGPVLREVPLLDSAAVRRLWRAHLSGRANAAPVLWGVLMLIDWKVRFGVQT